MKNKQGAFSLWYLLIIFWIIVLFQDFFQTPHPVDIAYSNFIKLLKADKLDNVVLGETYVTANVKKEDLN